MSARHRLFLQIVPAQCCDISWFTESMAAGQPVPVECRHRLEVSRVEA